MGMMDLPEMYVWDSPEAGRVELRDLYSNETLIKIDVNRFGPMVALELAHLIAGSPKLLRACDEFVREASPCEMDAGPSLVDAPWECAEKIADAVKSCRV